MTFSIRFRQIMLYTRLLGFIFISTAIDNDTVCIIRTMVAYKVYAEMACEAYEERISCNLDLGL